MNDSSSLPDQARLARRLSRFPACIGPLLEALPSADAAERPGIVRHIALCIGDETALRATLGLDPGECAGFYPETHPRQLSTEETVDSFLSRFSSPEAAAAPEVEELVIAPPAIDYAATYGESLPEHPDAPRADDSTSTAIEAFLEAVPRKETPRAEPPLSESLAKMMIKNGNYEKAIEIITELHLKNPKKSIYFADRIRFLRKLIELNVAKS